MFYYNYVLVSVVGVGHIAMNKTEKVLALTEFGYITFILTFASETIKYIPPQTGIHPISSPVVIITSQGYRLVIFISTDLR